MNTPRHNDRGVFGLRGRTRAAAALCAGLWFVPLCQAQILGGPEPPPVSWEQRVGEELPLAARFQTHDGLWISLGELFGERPVILALVYYECPMLCNLVLEGLVEGLRELSFDAGDDFSVVVVSIDPDEGSALASQKRGAYLDAYERAGAEEDWTFLVGGADEIKQVADAVGFQYTYVEQIDEYAHGAGVTVLTSEGVVSRILFGASFEPKDLRLALVEAGEGKVGSAVDQFLLRCFHYDPTRGKYGFAILSVLRLGGTLTVLVLGAVVLRQFLRDRHSDPEKSLHAPARAV